MPAWPKSCWPPVPSCSSEVNDGSLNFFTDGIQPGDTTDDYFDQIERASTIYIGRNEHHIIINTCEFYYNGGVFGGAININSPTIVDSITDPKWVVIYNTKFHYNFSFLGGNAVYIRLRKQKQQFDKECLGVKIKDCEFIRNSGLKRQNGGAVSIVCNEITLTHIDTAYLATTTTKETQGNVLMTERNVFNTDVFAH